MFYTCKCSAKSVTEILEKIISPVLYSTNHSLKGQNTISLKTGVLIKRCAICISFKFFCQGKFYLAVPAMSR